MATDIKKIQGEIERSAHESGKFFDNVLDELAALNKATEEAATRLYDGVLRTLELHPATGIPENSVKNLSFVGKLMNGLERIQSQYRGAYGRLARSFREEGVGLTADKERRFSRLFRGLGVEDGRDRRVFDKESFELLDLIHKGGLMRVNQMLERWKTVAYNTFHSSIVKGLPLIEFRRAFYNGDGSIRVGSSLNQESTQATMNSITQQRTTFLRNEAKKEGMTYCWNFNPMDFRTKPECLQATMAGVISERQMAMEHGFPPRYICRCDITFTRPEWAGVNSAVNAAIDDRRQRLFVDMRNDPSSFQKSKWKRKGKWVYPKEDILRLQGNKMYAQTAEKLDLLADPVPDYTGIDLLALSKKENTDILKQIIGSVGDKDFEDILSGKFKDVQSLKTFILTEDPAELKPKWAEFYKVAKESLSSGKVPGGKKLPKKVRPAKVPKDKKVSGKRLKTPVKKSVDKKHNGISSKYGVEDIKFDPLLKKKKVVGKTVTRRELDVDEVMGVISKQMDEVYAKMKDPSLLKGTIKEVNCITEKGGVVGQYHYDSKIMDIACDDLRSVYYKPKDLLLKKGAKAKADWHAVDSVEGTVRHEIGHSLLDVFYKSTDEDTFGVWVEWRKIFRSKSDDYWSKNVSEYGSTNALELFAESFAGVTDPDYKRGMLPKVVEDFLDKFVEF